MKSEFGGLLLDAPDDWGDITPDLEDEYPPTLARDDGFGALQFSGATYESGEKPNIAEQHLIQLFSAFCDRQGLDIRPRRLANAASLCVGGMTKDSETLVSVWLLTNGMDVTLATYVADSSELGVLAELQIAEQIIESATFPRDE